MHIVQVVHVRIKPGMENLWSKATYDRVAEWLTHWTCVANFRACLGASRDEALDMARGQLRESLVPSWLRSESGVSPDHFEFEVSDQEVLEGKFWMSGALVWCKWHPIGGEP